VRFIGEYYRFQLGRGVLTDAMVRQVYNAGIGTGTGSTAGTPISRGGVMASTDGVVIDLDLATGVGNFFPDKSGNGYHAISFLSDHTHKIPKRDWELRSTRTATGYLSYNTSSGQQLVPNTTNSWIDSVWAKSTADITALYLGDGTGANASNLVAVIPTFGSNTWTKLTLLKNTLTNSFDILSTFTGSATVQFRLSGRELQNN
jgi:hypothetical protein